MIRRLKELGPYLFIIGFVYVDLVLLLVAFRPLHVNFEKPSI